MRQAEHVDGPTADYAICGAGDDIVSILRADKRYGVDWVGVASCRGSSQRSLLDWKRRSGACVPEKDLPTV